MGVYLSKPITEKVSSDYQNSWLKCGVSSMQGWRASQEDAHNCCLDYDEDCSFFAVYDGHGGHEVAEYTAKYFPDFLKKVEAYKTGEFEKALEDAFIDFDNTLKDEAVVEELKAIAVNKSSGDDHDNSEDEVDVQELREEARMPLNDLIAKYTSGSVKAGGVKSVLAGESSGLPASPYLRAKPASSGAGSSKDCDPPIVNGTAESNGETPSQSSKECDTTKDSPDEGCSSKDSAEAGTSLNGEHAVIKEEDKKLEEKEDKKSEEKEDKKLEEKDLKKGGCSSTTEDDEDEHTTMKSVIRIAKKKATVTLLAKLFESNDSESDSSNDESFLANDTSVKDEDDDEVDDEVDEEGDEEDEEGADEEAEEEEDSDDESAICDTGGEVAGSDSGCTAVAALVRGTKVYVANAGDSRAVLCRGGKAVDLSVDHKPDDEAEMARITAAGGRVTSDGRVNGGLNLSRALGDHSYKQSAGMDARSQMITALPDIQVQDIDPSQDEFLVLACDGIWNSMSSQEVVDFVRPLMEKEEKLSAICGKLFDNCLAPDTMGDGTGCDNMTCIIVRFCERGASCEGEADTTDPPAPDSSKRPASPSPQDANKRPKVESQSS